jgi:hypothetical protein
VPVKDHSGALPDISASNEFLWLYETTSRGLDDRLGASVRAEFLASVVEVKIDRSLGQAETLGDLRRCPATRSPGQYFRLAIIQLRAPRPDLGTRDDGQAGINDRFEDTKVDRLGNVIIRAQLSSPQFVIAIGQRVKNTNGTFSRRTEISFKRSSISKPDI